MSPRFSSQLQKKEAKKKGFDQAGRERNRMGRRAERGPVGGEGVAPTPLAYLGLALEFGHGLGGGGFWQKRDGTNGKPAGGCLEKYFRWKFERNLEGAGEWDEKGLWEVPKLRFLKSQLTQTERAPRRPLERISGEVETHVCRRPCCP